MYKKGSRATSTPIPYRSARGIVIYSCWLLLQLWCNTLYNTRTVTPNLRAITPPYIFVSCLQPMSSHSFHIPCPLLRSLTTTLHWCNGLLRATHSIRAMCAAGLLHDLPTTSPHKPLGKILPHRLAVFNLVVVAILPDLTVRVHHDHTWNHQPMFLVVHHPKMLWINVTHRYDTGTPGPYSPPRQTAFGS